MEDLTLRILLVEDQESKRNVICKYIRSLNEKALVEFSTSQIEALNTLEKVQYDLLLLDMCLPLRSGDDPDERAGEHILEELDLNDDYIRPAVIVAMTQFDQLQEDVRQKYPELGAVKYSKESMDWQSAIKRIIKSCIRTKEKKRTIIYCEEKNDELFNHVGLNNLEFRGLKGGSRKVYESAKFEKENYAVRDKDYLTRKEVKWLTESKFDNYFILEYYCFENYLYHPDNLEEYFSGNRTEFDKQKYIDEITRQKTEKLLNIVQGLQVARNAYFDFTDNEKKNMDKEPEVIDCLKSNCFAEFYPYFDMKGTDKKKGFDKTVLADWNINKKKLVTTDWFRKKMEILFSKALN
jgi:CheY-like chemotaxis protein